MAKLPKSERADIVSSLTEDEADALLHEWRGFNARPDQISPDALWDIWLVLSGRGWGKTRTGAEWVREEVASGRAKRIALIAETAADGRDVIVEGDSGILACHAEKDRPLYEPSKRRLTWQNGAVATVFNATEPDQLRGPQFDLAWCFIAGTSIRVMGGDAAIESIKPGDRVMTRAGLRRVLFTSSHKENVGRVKFSNGAELVGTANHPVLTSHGWVMLSDLKEGDDVCVGNALSGAGSSGTDTAADTSNTTGQNLPGGKTGPECTGLSMSRITGQSRTGWTFTTSTVTRPTTILRTLSRLTDQITFVVTWLATSVVGLPMISPQSKPSAVAVPLSFAGSTGQQSAKGVSRLMRTPSGQPNANASAAEKPSQAYGEVFAVSVVSTWEPDGVQTVYNLQVDGLPEYFANGILVHNCDELAKWKRARETWDMLQFGLRLGSHPRVLVTTTPRPIELVRAIISGAEGRVSITRGKTSDNSSNLAATFLQKIHERYANTRLGRQELDGEILSDLPDALWTYATVESARVRDVPAQMGRVVVAVDPAVTSNEDSDMHGIVAAGASPDGKTAYVLEDGSCRGEPLVWARRAVALFDAWEADAIVVEVNQGGDMVAQTIRSVRSNIPIRQVRATRGKHVRAEPASSLYSQGRVHHVGGFPELEQQMTLMTSHGYEGDGSPDRVDALVWALADLIPAMIAKKPNRAAVQDVPVLTYF